MRPGAPLRFLGLVLVGWIGLRVGVHAPEWLSSPDQVTADRAEPTTIPVRPREVTATTSHLASPQTNARPPVLAQAGSPPRSRIAGIAPPLPAGSAITWSGTSPQPIIYAPSARASALTNSAPPSVLPLPHGERSRSSRWSGSAWLLLRREEGTATLAPGGTLGGSQAGARLLFRLNDDTARPLALSARAYLPLRRIEAAEVALGLDWQPAAGVPLYLLAERRQAVGREGRSAFALTLHGGHSARLAGLRIDAYGQAGIVGLRSRDLFVDGAVRVAAPIGPVELGGGLWGAAQPGAARLDAGPQLALPLRAGRTNFRLAAEYRFRVAGDAAPGSGPVLTLGAGF
ncbi:MAG: hypothetical protein ACT4N8_00075 [Sphingosinicella sp.]|uniref:hypothetical protein n=1 Tax=Sphingosinicella sp. TaxID=1917971 RepID=UPI0040381070